jgi:ABC-2 type transport system permease protein
MSRLIRAEFRKLASTRLWLWILAACTAWAAGYTALAIGFAGRSGSLTPSLASAAGQHALLANGAGVAGPLAAILAATGVTAEYRHRTATATFLAAPARGRVIAAKLGAYLLAGASYAVVSIAVSLAIALPWLHARGTSMPLGGNDNPAVLTAVLASAAIFAVAGAGLGALTASQVATVTTLLIYLFVAEPLLSHIGAWHAWTPYLPGVAADGLTQAVQPGVRLLSPWAGGIVFAAWAAALAAAGTWRTSRRDIT